MAFSHVLSNFGRGLKGLKVQAAVDFLQDMQEMLQVAKESMKIAQDRAQFYANHGRSPQEIEVGTWVNLKIPKDAKVLRTRKCHKLSPRYSGPYKAIKKINPVSYQLDLPIGVGVHPVFHVSHLKERLSRKDSLFPEGELVELEDLSTFVNWLSWRICLPLCLTCLKEWLTFVVTN
ncbi:hypothetical protein O6H91_21G028500 [Diphasiastrum complanatum]|uniref:Uncharacterized protein n=1 Tax=Diphasiastrum complanatum TaxID=34168 RepID=A0ACC2AIZ2_DIPCM|nr:hypothetical protein O6H91_21G028500 [Diphasiastrum complanatum]